MEFNNIQKFRRIAPNLRVAAVTWLCCVLGFLTLKGEAATPTEYEQYMLELVNRARANPGAEVNRLASDATTQPGYWGSYFGFNSYDKFAGGAGLNEGPPSLGGAATSISDSPKQPLAFNVQIMDAARGYAAVLQGLNYLTHTANGTTSEGRMAAAGFAPEFPWSDAVDLGGNRYTAPGHENLAFNATSGPWDDPGYPGDVRGEAVHVVHHNLFVDTTATGRGHRLTMMVADFQECGIGFNWGVDPGGFNSIYAVFDAGHRADRGPFITGVAFNDVVDDDFYTPESGEALGGLSVTVYRAGTATEVATGMTFPTGGYGVAVPGDGTYDVRFAGQQIDQTYYAVNVGSENVKVDAVDPGNSPPEPATGFKITQIVRKGDDIRLTWESMPGAAYQVWTSTDLTNWTVIPGSSQTGGAAAAVTSYTHSKAAGGGRKFYRVERL